MNKKKKKAKIKSSFPSRRSVPAHIKDDPLQPKWG